MSKLLTRFESVEQAVPEMFEVLRQALALRSQIYMEATHGGPRVFAWRAHGLGAGQLATARTHARSAFEYLVGHSGSDDEPTDGDDAPAEKRRTFIVLPLAVARRPIFGVLQLEGEDPFVEIDLVFVNAVANQLAIAVDRYQAIEARQATAETKRFEAEQARSHAEHERARAEDTSHTARMRQVHAEQERDIAAVARTAAETSRTVAEALRERFEGLVDNLDHAFVWEADARTFHLFYVSARVEALLGYSRQRWLAGREMWTSCLHADDRDAVFAMFRRAAEERKDQRCDHRCIATDGRMVWFHTGVHYVAAPMPRLQGVSLDITPAKQAEERIHAQLDLTRSVAGSLGECLVAVDHGGRITLWNAAAELLMGCAEEHALGKLVQEVIQLQTVAGAPLSAEWPTQQAMRRRAAVRGDDLQVALPGRAAITISYTAAPILRDDTIAGAVLAFADITERKRAEDAARAAAKRFQFLAESMPQKIFTAGPDGRVDYLNGQWSEFTGLSLDEMRDWGWTQFIHADDLDDNLRRWRHSIGTGEPFVCEHRFRRADGVYRWHLSRAHAMRDDRGAVTMWIGSNTDIDDQKRAEQAQRVLVEISERLLSVQTFRETLHRIAIVSVPQLADFCIVDEVLSSGAVRKVEVVFADEAKQRDLGETSRRFAPQPGWRTPQARALETGTPVLLSSIPDLDTIAQDDEHARFLGAIEPVSMMVVPLISRGKILGAITFGAAESARHYRSEDLIVAQEVAHLATLALDNALLVEQAQRETRERQDLLSVVSHDLRSPLTTIKLTLDMLAPSSTTDDRRRSRKQIESMKHAVSRMDHLLEDLLVTSSLEAGKLSLQRSSIAVVPFVHDTIEAMQSLAATKRLSLTSELTGDLKNLAADRERLQRVFANLIGNAIKFTPAGGSVVVRAEPDGNAVRFSVADTGAGIPPADLPHVFERFWQARSTARQGTGLGLSIVKGIVEAHGGSVSVKSEVGVGTTFSFSVPAGAADAAVANEVAPQDPASNLRAEVEKHALKLEAHDAAFVVRELPSESERGAHELAEDFRGDFIGLVTHELRAPLTKIELSIERLRRDSSVPPTPGQAGIIHLLEAATARLTAVIEALLRHVQLESGPLTTRISTFDVFPLVSDVIGELRPYAEEKGLELRLVVSGEDAHLTSDPELTRLMVLALVGNAIHFTDHGSVEIAIDCTPSGCRFAVSDTGPGTTQEERARTFVALALVREIAAALGGHVELASQVGRGSTFTVELPSGPVAESEAYAPQVH